MNSINETAPSTNYEHTTSIPIPGKKNCKIMDEYSLKLNFFDPNKSSPPNSWNDRLLQRIGSKKNFHLNNSFKLVIE